MEKLDITANSFRAFPKMEQFIIVAKHIFEKFFLNSLVIFYGQKNCFNIQ